MIENSLVRTLCLTLLCLLSAACGSSRLDNLRLQDLDAALVAETDASGSTQASCPSLDGTYAFRGKVVEARGERILEAAELWMKLYRTHDLGIDRQPEKEEAWRVRIDDAANTAPVLQVLPPPDATTDDSIPAAISLEPVRNDGFRHPDLVVACLEQRLILGRFVFWTQHGETQESETMTAVLRPEDDALIATIRLQRTFRGLLPFTRRSKGTTVLHFQRR